MPWPICRRVELQARRMHDMMERLDVDPLSLVRRRQGDAYADARTVCLHCGTSDKCLRWLEACDEDAPSPDFCPNRPLFESCRRK